MSESDRGCRRASPSGELRVVCLALDDLARRALPVMAGPASLLRLPRTARCDRLRCHRGPAGTGNPCRGGKPAGVGSCPQQLVPDRHVSEFLCKLSQGKTVFSCRGACSGLCPGRQPWRSLRWSRVSVVFCRGRQARKARRHELAVPVGVP